MPQLLFDLFQAYFEARKHKRKTKSAIKFELRQKLKLYKFSNFMNLDVSLF